MAPIRFLADVLPETFYHIVHRNSHFSPRTALDLGSENGSDYTLHERLVLQIIATTFSSLSVASAWLAFYWFLRMRRSFRHDLIMLLIQSDMFKAFWFLVYPVAIYINGPFDSRSAFCQVNGFFISVGIEAADISVLMIAIHSALCVLRPQHGAGEGLYPYRRYGYACWIIFPLLMASLAFINPDEAYVSQGTYCYLPNRPVWYGLVLSWVPRYLVLLTIIFTYVTIYLFVRFKLKRFNNYRETNVTSKRRQQSLPSTPPPTYPGMTPDSEATVWGDSTQERKESASTLGSWRTRIPSIPEEQQYIRRSWPSTTTYTLPSDTAQNTPRQPSGRKTSRASSQNPLLFASPSTIGSENQTPSLPQNVHFPHATRRQTLTQTPVIELSTPSLPSKNRLSRMYSRASHHSIFSFLQRGDGDQGGSALSRAEMADPDGLSLAFNDMMRTREKMRKQLKFLFVYPLIYISMWILPFVSHIYEYRQEVSPDGKPFSSFGLDVVTLMCLTIQGAVDCWVFSTREKPWRHIPGHDGSFLGSLKFWKDDLRFWKAWKGLRSSEIDRKGPGRTRAEMATDARLAYKRRDEENAARRQDTNNTPPFVHRRERSFRDQTDVFYFTAEGTRAYHGMGLVEEESGPFSPYSAYSPGRRNSDPGEIAPDIHRGEVIGLFPAASLMQSGTMSPLSLSSTPHLVTRRLSE